MSEEMKGEKEDPDSTTITFRIKSRDKEIWQQYADKISHGNITKLIRMGVDCVAQEKLQDNVLWEYLESQSQQQNLTKIADKLAFFINKWVEFIRDTPMKDKKANFFNYGIALGDPNPEKLKSLKKAHNHYVQNFQKVIDEGIRVGEFRKDIDREVVSQLILTALEGAQLYCAIDGEELNWDQIGNVLSKMIVNELMK